MYKHSQQQQFNMSQYHSQKKLKPQFSQYSYNQTLQQLLQVQTVHQNLSSTKKNIFFSQLSFFSKDHTNDHTNQQGYQQILKKIHFQRQRSRQLQKQLQSIKKNHIDMYMTQLMDTFNQLSQENKILREQYKKQTRNNNKKVNNSMKDSSIINKKNSSIVFQKNNSILNTANFSNMNCMNFNNSQTPKNIKTRRSIAGGCIARESSSNLNTNLNMKHGHFNFNNAFIHHKKPQHIDSKHLIKQSNCQSSINFNNNNNNLTQQQHIQQIKKHKRRQSQLTQRKDYPNQLDYLQIFDDKSQFSNNNDNDEGYMIKQNGKIMKKYQIRQIQCQFEEYKRQEKCLQNVYMNMNNNNINRHNIINNFRQQQQQQYFYEPTSSKNIFLQFLQQLLLQQQITSTQLSSQISDNIQQTLTQQQLQSCNLLSLSHIKHIESLQQQILKKNRKLQQLQQVINVFKEQIEQIIGKDIKQVNQILVSLINVKGKYLDMQSKVNNIKVLKQKYHQKQQIKKNVVKEIAEKNKNKYNNTNKQQQPFPIPQSIKTLFQILQLQLPQNPRPIDYLTQIKHLSKNKQLYHAFNSNKRPQTQNKIKQIIDSIRQGRKKFNQIIQIYQTRIIKLQQKISKYKQKVNQSVSNTSEKQKNNVMNGQKYSQNKIKRNVQNKQNYC